MAAHQLNGVSAPAVFHFQSIEVRTVSRDGEAWFVASDVSRALGYPTAKDMTRILDEEEKGRQIVPTLSSDQSGRGGGEQEVIIISESGLYHAVLRSRKPQAKPFRRWVTTEVLPAIRKTGGYRAATVDGQNQPMSGCSFNFAPGKYLMTVGGTGVQLKQIPDDAVMVSEMEFHRIASALSVAISEAQLRFMEILQ